MYLEAPCARMPPREPAIAFPLLLPIPRPACHLGRSMSLRKGRNSWTKALQIKYKLSSRNECLYPPLFLKYKFNNHSGNLHSDWSRMNVDAISFPFYVAILHNWNYSLAIHSLMQQLQTAAQQSENAKQGTLISRMQAYWFPLNVYTFLAWKWDPKTYQLMLMIIQEKEVNLWTWPQRIANNS